MNLKRFLTFFKQALMLGAMLLTLAISSCDDDDDGPKIYNGTVLQLMGDAQFEEASGVSADVALDSLMKYLSIYPELTTLLTSSTEVTVFAPSNTAFKSLLATPGFPTNIADINPEIIAGVLAYHIVPGTTYLQADLTSGLALTTAYPAAAATDRININADGTLKTGSSNQAVVITDANNQATNGVVHTTLSVLIPQSVGATLTPILGTMAGTVLLGADFSYLADLVRKADATFTETATEKRISTLLANPAANATFFATPNPVFVAAAGGEANVDAFIGTFTPATARAILLNHYVSGKYTVDAATGSSTLSNGLTLTPATGTGKNITVITGNTNMTPYGVGLSNTPATATSFRPIVVKDLAHSNGVIQVFAGILQ